MTPTVLVIGLGNLVLSDDGVGVQAIERLRNSGPLPEEVMLLDGGTQGLNLLSFLSGFERILVIDAVDAGRPPGTVIRMEGDALDRLPGKASVHQLGFSDLLIALRLLGECPKEVIVLGVQPESTDWGTELSAPVSASMTQLIALAREQLDQWCSVALAV